MGWILEDGLMVRANRALLRRTFAAEKQDQGVARASLAIARGSPGGGSRQVLHLNFQEFQNRIDLPLRRRLTFTRRHGDDLRGIAGRHHIRVRHLAFQTQHQARFRQKPGCAAPRLAASESRM